MVDWPIGCERKRSRLPRLERRCAVAKLISSQQSFQAAGFFILNQKMYLMKKKQFYFSTKDLMMMAALAALGGVASTYINFIGDFFQSMLGFAGTTQWAAGLHVIWIMLAAAIIRKSGAATMTGVLKGFVEFLSGNTHGLLVLIVNILAGLIVDFVLLPKREKQPGFLFYLAAGLASASNIIVFQFFASIPEDILTLFAILLTSGIAFVSGFLFGGVLVRSLLGSLRKIGILNDQAPLNNTEKYTWVIGILFAAVLLAIGAGFLYYQQLSNSNDISIEGNIKQPFLFSEVIAEFQQVEIEAELNGVKRMYSGYPLIELVKFANPLDENSLLQITASDGYNFFISMDEVYENSELILSIQDVGGNKSFNIVGAESPKAWVRGVVELKVIATNILEIQGKSNHPFSFNPSEWVNEMDSTFVRLGDKSVKLQGVALRALWIYAEPEPNSTDIVISSESQVIKLNSKEFNDSDEIRLFTYLDEEGMEFILGRMNGEVLLRNVTSMEIK